MRMGGARESSVRVKMILGEQPVTLRDERTVGRCDELIRQGEEVLRTKRSHRPGVIAPDFVDEAAFFQWQVSSLSFLEATVGEASIHFSRFRDVTAEPRYSEASRGVAVLRATSEDLRGGYLAKYESLIHAELFTDFLDMAEHLSLAGYVNPAASLTGAVLENGLRKLAIRSGINVAEADDISALNQKLAAKGIYNRLVQKQIHAWKAVRDAADHGRFSEYSKEDVDGLVSGVRHFLGRMLV